MKNQYRVVWLTVNCNFVGKCFIANIASLQTLLHRYCGSIETEGGMWLTVLPFRKEEAAFQLEPQSAKLPFTDTVDFSTCGTLRYNRNVEA